MKRNPAWLLSLAIALAPAAQAAEPAPEVPAPARSTVEDPAPAATYDLFIDGVTGYAFIKTPVGWKFVKNMRAEPAPELTVSMR